MTGKRLLTVSLLLPLMVVSGVVHADATTIKKKHWANEPRGYSFRDSSALERNGPHAQALPEAPSHYGWSAERCAYQYQSGPKSNLIWSCRR
jgi:hypothetical protein